MTRRDLSLVQQAVQCGHACIEAARGGLIARGIEHPHLIVCVVADEGELRALAEALTAEGIRCARFAEPDLGDALTAICTEPVDGARRGFFRKLRLMKGPEDLPRGAAKGGACAPGDVI